MKKFQFRFESLLLIKKRKEDDEIRKFSEVVSQINLLKEEKDNLFREINRTGDEVGRLLNHGTSLNAYREYADISRFLNLKIQSLESSIEQKEPELELARIRLTEASKEKKVMELLKEKDWKEFKKKIRKEEKKELEEYLTINRIFGVGSNAQLPLHSESEPRDKSTLKSDISTGLNLNSEEWIWEDQKDWDDHDEIRKEEKPLSEYEKLQQYYNQQTKK